MKVMEKGNWKELDSLYNSISKNNYKVNTSFTKCELDIVLDALSLYAKDDTKSDIDQDIANIIIARLKHDCILQVK